MDESGTDYESNAAASRLISFPLPAYRYAVPALMGLFALAAAVSRFVGQRSYQSTFADDFYYYLAVAESIARGDGSTFFGSPTNGYHPLWMLCLSTIVRLFGSGSAGFVAISLLIAGLVVGVFAVLARTGVNLGLRPSAALVAALFAGSVALPLAHIGLETGLVLLALSGALLWTSELIRRAARPSYYLLGGLATSSCVLARLDSVAILAGLFLAVGLCLSKGGRLREVSLGTPFFVVGLIPIVIYVFTNILFFDSLLQSSAGAKSLAPGSFPSFKVIRELATQSFSFPAVLGTAGGVVLALGLASIRAQRAAWPAPAVLVLAGSLAGIVGYYVALGWLSSWPVQAWYAYPLVLSVFLLAALVLNGLPRLEPLALFSSVLLVSVFLGIVEPSINAWQRADAVGQRIEAWAAEHPGSFAMGDLAGNTAWRLQRPFVQLEGLVMPPEFVDHIRAGESLHAVLRDARSRYYVAIIVERDGDGCYRFREPLLASGTVTGMTGRYCGEPLLAGQALDLPYYVFPVDADGWRDQLK